MRLGWSPLAVERVAEIAEYIAADRPGAAEDWVDGLFAAVERLKRFPRSGRRDPEASRDDLREIFFGDYRVIYRVDRDEVLVLTVRRTSQLPDVSELE